VAASLSAFIDYYAKDAETWELLALTRARVAWTTDAAFGVEVEQATRAILRSPRDRARAAADTRAMRRLMEKERPPKGEWDLKLSPGGLVDLEFIAQYLQLVSAETGGPLLRHTGEALAAFEDRPGLEALKKAAPAWALQQDLSQLLRVALPDGADPSQEPAGFRALVAKAAGAGDFGELKSTLKAARQAARAAFDALVK
jgi:glutamate-ammonia-ligase adenylyltransferase